MHTHTLLLNSYYIPIQILSWQDAIKMVYEETVRVVVEYEDVVRSPSISMRLPAVVSLKRQVRDKIHGSVKFSRMNVYARDDFRCQYCGSRFTSDGLTYDHVVPKSAGGRREWRNIVSACSPCNLRKGNRTCDESGMFPLRMPKAPASLPIRGPRIDRSTAPDEWLDFIGVWSR